MNFASTTVLLITLLSCCLTAHAQTSAPAQTITVPRGTQIMVRLAEPVNTRTARAGDTVSAVVTQPVFSANNKLAIPAGTRAIVRVVGVVRGSRSSVPARLSLQVVALDFGDRGLSMQSIPFESVGQVTPDVDRTMAVNRVGTFVNHVVNGRAGGVVTAVSSVMHSASPMIAPDFVMSGGVVRQFSLLTPIVMP